MTSNRSTQSLIALNLVTGILLTGLFAGCSTRTTVIEEEPQPAAVETKRETTVRTTDHTDVDTEMQDLDNANISDQDFQRFQESVKTRLDHFDDELRDIQRDISKTSRDTAKRIELERRLDQLLDQRNKLQDDFNNLVREGDNQRWDSLKTETRTRWQNFSNEAKDWWNKTKDVSRQSIENLDGSSRTTVTTEKTTVHTDNP